MRVIGYTVSVLAFFFIFAVPNAYAAIVPCAGGSACRVCDLVQLAENIVTWLIGIAIFIAALIVVYVGFLMITGGGEEGSSLLKETVASIVGGIVILLLAWLIIDTVMKLAIGGELQIGPWNKIECVENPEIQAIANSADGTAAAQQSGEIPPAQPYTGVTGGGEQCATGNTACSVQSLKDLGYTDQQANVMSCIAMTESTGDPNQVNPNGQACGTFQVLPWHWVNNQQIRNLQGPNGENCSLATCRNAVCNAMAAKVLMDSRLSRGQSAYADWTCPRCNAKAQGCVTKFGG